MTRPLIGIPCCVKAFGTFGMPNHAVSDHYAKVVLGPVGGVPVLIPAVGEAVVEAMLPHLDGVLLHARRPVAAGGADWQGACGAGGPGLQPGGAVARVAGVARGGAGELPAQPGRPPFGPTPRPGGLGPRRHGGGRQGRGGVGLRLRRSVASRVRLARRPAIQAAVRGVRARGGRVSARPVRASHDARGRVGADATPLAVP